MSDLELPYAYGNPSLTAVLRAAPEDFQVEEILGYDADGEGEHALLWVEKRGSNTDWVAKELARFAGVPPLNVGYAGLKDRHAVTRQTFSVQLAGKPDPDWSTFPHAEVKVLAATRHKRKLKRGALRGNRFVLVLRDVQGDRGVAEQAAIGILVDLVVVDRMRNRRRLHGVGAVALDVGVFHASDKRRGDFLVHRRAAADAVDLVTGGNGLRCLARASRCRL